MDPIIKKSPIVIVAQFLISEFLATLAFIIASSLAYYAQIYRSLSIAHFVSFQIAELLFIFICQAVLLLYIFARWHRECFIVKPEGLFFQKGVLKRQRKRIAYSDIVKITLIESAVGKLLKYGTVVLQIKDAPDIIITYIGDPDAFIRVITHVQHSSRLPSHQMPHTPLLLPALLQTHEHHNLEFKTTFRWDMRGQKVNPDLERVTMKTIAGFLNSNGGQLVIGVDDAKTLVGLEHDYKTLNRQDADGFENHFSNIFNAMIGPSFRQYVTIQVVEHEQKHCGLVTVMPSTSPAYLKTSNSEEFFVRTGNNTTSLKLSEAQAYIQSRFRF